MTFRAERLAATTRPRDAARRARAVGLAGALRLTLARKPCPEGSLAATGARLVSSDRGAASRRTHTQRTPRALGAGAIGVRYLAVIAALAASSACRQKMADQPSLRPLEESAFFGDGRASRPLVEGTVAHGQLRDDDAFFAGKQDGVFVVKFPVPVDRRLLERGRERYNI